MPELDIEARKRILARFKRDAETDPNGFHVMGGKFREGAPSGANLGLGISTRSLTNAQLYAEIKADYERDYGVTEAMLEGVEPTPIQ